VDKEFGKVASKPMLFNLAEDAGERNDLAGTFPAKVKELQEAWRKWEEGLVPPAWLHHSLQKPLKKGS
jgi:hypothetical protein